MESTRIQESLEAPMMPRDEAEDRREAATAQFGINIVEVEDLDHQWQKSPVQAISLLPPFGVSQSSHLPTPQSPGNLASYLPGPAGSPLSSDHLRAGPSRQVPTFRSPSRPESAHPPKTPQRDPAASTPKTLLRTFPPPFGTHIVGKGRVTDPARPHQSQIATPSPEITRTRRPSAPNALSDPETTSTPFAKKQSSSDSYSGNFTLAPAPIISPTNSSHSTMYHVSPESHSGKHENQNAHNFDDPFIVTNDGGGKEGPNIKRRPSPPISNDPRHGSDSTSPLLRVHATGHGESGISRLVMSPSESSEAPSSGSFVKTEVKDNEYGAAVRTRHPAVLGDATPPQSPTLPHTPPPLGSARGSGTAPCTLPLEQSVARTPPRIAGGGMERIRQRQAELTYPREVESEKHRLDYLTRSKRARDNPGDEEARRDRENALPGLGVTVSPVKGRRLKLYRPVPLAGDPVAGKEYHRKSDDAEPKTPPPLSTVPLASLPTIALHATNWQTPRQRRTSPIIWTEDDELKKQKRLAAFAAPESSGSGRRLKPVDVPGQGRMVIDVTSEETMALAEAGILEMPPPDPLDDGEITLANGQVTAWPDSEYPWSLQGQQRDKEEEAERRKRLHCIERFLDRESESEEDDHNAAAGPSTLSPPPDVDTPPPSHTQQGRGKSILLNITPGSRRTAMTNRRSFKSANADARYVLLSKKHVREVADRIRRRRAAEEEEGIVMCICQGADDGRPMVRCDECRTWYHLVCMDITDESELGDDWFCWKCAPCSEDPRPAPVFEPTFAPVMPDTPPRTSVGDLPLYQSALQPSPILDMRMRAPVSPSVPSYPSRDRDRERSPIRRSRLPHVLGDPDDPVRGGPSTPYHARSMDSRLYSTPKFYDDYAGDDHMPFDPTSTPSRGLKFPNPVPITPRRPPAWAGQGLLWATPSGHPRSPQFSSQTPSSSARSLAFSLSTMEDSGGPLTSPWPPDESPVRRPHKHSESNYPCPPPRRSLDSPLAVRGGGNRAFLLGVEESPPPAVYAPQ